MAKDKDRLSQRLVSIKTSSAAQIDKPLPPPRTARTAREAARANVFRFGRIVLADRSILKCIIKDVSAGGVRVAIEANVALPERLILKIDQTGQTKLARVAWQKESEAGLQFIDE